MIGGERVKVLAGEEIITGTTGIGKDLGGVGKSFESSPGGGVVSSSSSSSKLELKNKSEDHRTPPLKKSFEPRNLKRGIGFSSGSGGGVRGGGIGRGRGRGRVGIDLGGGDGMEVDGSDEVKERVGMDQDEFRKLIG